MESSLLMFFNNRPFFPLPQAYSSPVIDYRQVREKLATQKSQSRKGLSKLLAKTRPSHPIAGETDPFEYYTGTSSGAAGAHSAEVTLLKKNYPGTSSLSCVLVVVSAIPSEGALHLQELMPEPDDKLEPVVVISDSQVSENASPDKLDQQDGSSARVEVEGASESQRRREDPEMSFENPFLKPAKRTRTLPVHNS